jgi:hypothetical protein
MEVIFFSVPTVLHAHHQGHQGFTNWDVQMMQGSPPLPSPIKRIFYMSSEGTNLHHEVGMQLSQRKRTIVTEMPYGNLNEISSSRKQGFVPASV